MSSILEPICRGLVSYVSYLASCGSSTVYSEYLLYEPLLRIAQSNGYDVSCKVAVSSGTKGDKKRIDFDLAKGKERLGVEVKWVKSKTPNVENDVKKLIVHNQVCFAHGYVPFFGQSQHLAELKPKTMRNPIAKGKLVSWNAGRTKYSARWFKYV